LIPRAVGREVDPLHARSMDRARIERNQRGGHVGPADLERANDLAVRRADAPPPLRHATNAFTTFAGEPPVRTIEYVPTPAGTTMVSAYERRCSRPDAVRSRTRSPATRLSTWKRPAVSSSAMSSVLSR